MDEKIVRPQDPKVVLILILKRIILRKMDMYLELQRSLPEVDIHDATIG